MEIVRFLDKDDNENKIFPIPSSARAWTSVILEGKCDSRRHALSLSVVLAKTSYQMLEIVSFSDWERA